MNLRSILRSLCLLALGTLAACQLGVPDQSDEPFRAKQMRRSGAGAEDCGDVQPSGLQSRSTNDCVVRAFQARRPFHARFWKQGIDSQIADGIAADASGAVYIYWFDSAPCGGPGCEPRLDERRCQKPYIREAPDGRRLACADPPFNEEPGRHGRLR